MKNKITALILTVAMIATICGTVAFAETPPDNARVLYTFYSDGTLNASLQHSISSQHLKDWQNTEKSPHEDGGASLKMTGELYLQGKNKSGKTVGTIGAISDEVKLAIEAGCAYLTYWQYIFPTNIQPGEEHYQSLDNGWVWDYYAPGNTRVRGEWVWVKSPLTNASSSNIYFKSKNTYVWYDDISIMIIPPADSSMKIEKVLFKDKNGTETNKQNVYYKSSIEVDFNSFVDPSDEEYEIKIVDADDESEIDSNVTFSGDKAILTPKSPLNRDKEYKIIFTDITNIFGESIISEEVLFKTAKPEIRTENENIKSSGEEITDGSIVTSAELICDIVNESDNSANLKLIFSVEKNGETVKAAAKDYSVASQNKVEDAAIDVLEINSFESSSEYGYKTYLLDEIMLPAEYEDRISRDTVNAQLSLKGELLNVSAQFAGAAKRAVTVLMVKAENDLPNFSEIGYFKTSFTDEEGKFTLEANVSTSVKTGNYFIYLYGEGLAQPEYIRADFIGEDTRAGISQIIENGTKDEIKTMLSDPLNRTNIKAIGIMLDEYEEVFCQEEYICSYTAEDVPLSSAYGDCVNLLNRYIVLAQLKESKNSQYAELIIKNSNLLGIDERIKSVFENVIDSNMPEAYNVITGYKDITTVLNFKEQIKTVAALTAVNVISGNDYPSVLKAFEDFSDVLLVDVEESFKKANISEYNQTLVLKSLIGRAFKDVPSLKKAFNDAVNSYMPKKQPVFTGGGGGGGSGGSSKVSVTEKFSVEGNVEKISEDADKIYIIERFTDLSGFEWAQQAIAVLNRNGMINGYPDNTFRPEAYITRAEFIKIIISGMFENYGEDNTKELSFNDISESDWFYPYVNTSVQIGLVNGLSDAEFGADDCITREQMAVICMRAIDKLGLSVPNTKTEKFKDSSDVSEYAQDAVTKLKSVGIISGDENGYFNPGNYASRAEASKIIYEVYRLISK